MVPASHPVVGRSGAAGADAREALRRAASPLSDCQQRTFRLATAELHVLWAERVALRFTGVLPVAALDAALQELVRRHAILRTVFLPLGGRPMQCVRSVPRGGLLLVDLAAIPGAQRESVARRLGRERRPMDVWRGPLVRTVLVRLSPLDHVLLLTLHHLLFDGWSQAVMFRELAALFLAFSLDLPSPLPEITVPFAELARREQDPGQATRRAERLREWVGRLRGLRAPATLPLDRPRPAHTTHRAQAVPFVVPEASCRALRAVAEAEGMTMFMLGLGAVALALRASDPSTEEVAVGVALANRGSVEAQALIGPFVNILIVRVPTRGELTMLELLRHARGAVLDAFAFQDVPFDRVMEELDPGSAKGSYGPRGREPFFRVCVDFTEGAEAAPSSFPQLTLGPFETGDAVAGCDLYVSFSAGRGTLRGRVLYSTELFDRSTIDAFIGRLLAVLGSLDGPRDRTLAEVRL